MTKERFDAWPDVSDGQWLRNLAQDTFGDHHRQHNTQLRLLSIADRIERASNEPCARRRPTLEESNAWQSAEEERDWWRTYAMSLERAGTPPGACNCLAVINTLIKPGDLRGNGCDETAQRNGVILAFNAVAEHQRSTLTKAGE